MCGGYNQNSLMLQNEYNSSLLSRKIKVGYLELRFNDPKIGFKNEKYSYKKAAYLYLKSSQAPKFG